MTRRGLACLSGGLLCLLGCRESATGPDAYRYYAQIAAPTVDYWWSNVTYPHPLTVRVVPGTSPPTAGVRGVPVRFSLVAGQGRFRDTVVATDANGFATAGPWIVGAPSTNTVGVAIPSGSNADSLRLRFVTEVLIRPATIVEYRLTAEGAGTPQPLPDGTLTDGRIWLADDGTFVEELAFSQIPLVWPAASDAIGTYARTDSVVRFVVTASGLCGCAPTPNGKLVRDSLFTTRYDYRDDADGLVLVNQVFFKTGPIELARGP